MNKLEKTFMIGMVVAALGIVVFWVAGFYDRLDISAIAFFAAGIAAWIALIAGGLNHLRRR